MSKLAEAIQALLEKSFPRYSRIHPLRSFSQSQCYVKREDELGFGISGTKIRKYLSLLPAILKQAPDEVVLMGSAYSNHVLSLSQLLKENGIEPILFLLGNSACKMQGNLFYSSLIVDSKNRHFVSRHRWRDIDQIANDYARERAQKQIKTIVLPKGANCAAALPGALTLALDILRNEEENGITFDHLLIDSGTGMTACALLLAFTYLRKPTFVHIIQIAGDQEEFHQLLEERRKDLEKLLNEAIPSPTQFKLYTPTTAPSFGSTNTTIFKEIVEIARQEGFLTDPVFTAKLFHEGKKILIDQSIQGNILFIHSGGGLSLSGFQEEIAKII